MQEKIPDFPNAIEAFFLILALFLAEFVVGGLFYDARNLLNLSYIEASVLITLLGNGVVFTAVMHCKHLSYRSLFHHAKVQPNHTFFAFLPPILLIVPGLVLAMVTLSTIVSSLVPLSEAQGAMFGEMSSNHFAMLLAACVLAPVLEEMLFRGIILRSFLHQYPRWPAIIGSAILFGFAHGNLYQFVVATLLGVVMGWLYERSNSLLPSMSLHAVYNSSLHAVNAMSDPKGPDLIDDSSAVLWVVAALLAAYGVHGLHRLVGKTK